MLRIKERLSWTNQHKKHGANQVLGYFKAALSSPCNILLHPCCKKLLTKIPWIYSAITVPTDCWLPWWQGRAIRQQSSTPSWDKARSLPHRAGCRGKAGQRQGHGGEYSFPEAAPQRQTSVYQVSEMEV